jgi:hypothetical protein
MGGGSSSCRGSSCLGSSCPGRFLRLPFRHFFGQQFLLGFPLKSIHVALIWRVLTGLSFSWGVLVFWCLFLFWGEIFLKPGGASFLHLPHGSLLWFGISFIKLYGGTLVGIQLPWPYSRLHPVLHLWRPSSVWRVSPCACICGI